MTTETAGLKILGTNDDVTTCECCGRSDLKATVVLGDAEHNVVGHFGSQCAARKLGWVHRGAVARVKDAAINARPVIAWGVKNATVGRMVMDSETGRFARFDRAGAERRAERVRSNGSAAEVVPLYC